MTFVCLWISDWSIAAASIVEVPEPDQLMEGLLRVAPRVTIAAPGLIWADARGLPERELAGRLCGQIQDSVSSAVDVQTGIARTPVAAEIAARHGSQRVTVVSPGEDRGFLAPHPLSVLSDVVEVDPALLSLLTGVGIETCGDLAALEREEVEVRCGAAGVRLWRLARAEDRRRPFGAFPRTLPRASCAWTDYALRDAERLLFVIRRLVVHICDALRSQGEGARALLLRFALVNRTVVDHPCTAAHPTADSAAWLRLIRTDLERLHFSDAVVGITVRVAAASPTLDCQGDIFDRGFATARATEQAVAQLLDACGTDAYALTITNHPLLERRPQWRVREPVTLETWTPGLRSTSSTPAPSLTVQLLASPRSVRVVTTVRRDHDVPVRYHEGEVAIDVLMAIGPDYVDGGAWEEAPYSRAYFHCVTSDGRLVLLFRASEEWFLHGWWD